MATCLEVTLVARLLLPDLLPVAERLLADRAPDRSGEAPDWMPEMRTGGLWSVGHQWPAPGGRKSVRKESAIRYDARLAARELQAGR